MKNRIFTTLLLTGLFWFPSKAQNVNKETPYINEFIRHEADSVKQQLFKNGFVILQESSVTMESAYEMPIIVPLAAGDWYQFVFIGDISSRLFEVRMFDWDERQVAYEKQNQSDINGNIISYTYIAQSSQYHMIKPLQVNKKKKKGLCGYVMLLKKVR